MNCTECNSREISNKYFKLCKICNQRRLDKKKALKASTNIINKRKSVKVAKSERISYSIDKGTPKESMIDRDERFYERCFNKSNHKCENCGDKLPTQFRNEDGEVIARWRYSHVIPKSIAPALRHIIKNINNLCLDCHEEWENGDKENMKIYAKNKENFPEYF